MHQYITNQLPQTETQESIFRKALEGIFWKVTISIVSRVLHIVQNEIECCTLGNNLQQCLKEIRVAQPST